MSESISEVLERMSAGGETPQADAPELPVNDAASEAERAADDLRKQVEAATRRASDAEARAHAEAQRRADAERRAQEASQQVEVTSQAAVTNALEAAKADANRLRAELRKAHEDGDYGRVADLQFDLGRIGARVEQLETGAHSFEQRRTEALRREPERPVQPADPIEADLAGRTPRTASWLREHRNFYTDSKFRARVMAAHNLAVADDIAPDTDAYFDLVERTVGLKNEAPQSPAPKLPRPSGSILRMTTTTTATARCADDS